MVGDKPFKLTLQASIKVSDKAFQKRKQPIKRRMAMKKIMRILQIVILISMLSSVAVLAASD